MKISMKWLKEKRACDNGAEWFKSQEETDGLLVVKKLLKENQLDWANWLIVRIMERKQYLAYAIFAAEQVLDIYEKKYPDNKKPREAIDAARKVLEEDSEQNRKTAAYSAIAAAAAAYSAVNSAAAAAAAAYSAVNSADAAAAAAAYAAVNSAAYATAAAYAAVNSAVNSADAATAVKGQKMKIKILEYGIGLLTGGQNSEAISVSIGFIKQYNKLVDIVSEIKRRVG